MSKKFAAVLIAGTAMTMAACTSSHPSSTVTKSASSVKSSVSAKAGSKSGTSKSAPVTHPGGSIPTSVANNPKVRHEATLNQAQCRAVSGGWQAGGTANNPGKSATTFTITVFFTSAHATVLSSKATTVKVAVGKTEKWSVTSKLTAPKTVLCVLRGVSTSQ